MQGLLRGTVALYPHDDAWHIEAAETVALLRELFVGAAVQIEHVGSTAVPGLAAKPIMDIVIGMRALSDMDAYLEKLAQKNIREASQDVPAQRLLVSGDFERNTRTHHIHVVIWNSVEWKHYVRFRDYLNAFEKRRKAYEAEKLRLAGKYPDNRADYTMGKAALIGQLLDEADRWAEGRNMAKVIMLCGKIASGKSTYAKRICREENAVMLSVDELVISVLGSELGDKHDEITGRVQAYLFEKSLDIVRAGTNVLLDWGFWTKEKRQAARMFYESRGIACECHYIDTPDEVWRRNIEIRNAAVLAGSSDAYFVDEGLMQKLESLFEAPSRDEIDVWHVNDWR